MPGSTTEVDGFDFSDSSGRGRGWLNAIGNYGSEDITRSLSPARLVRFRCGMAGINRFEDLIAWQLSEELKERVLAFTDRPAVARNRDFCDDIRRAARSAPANLAEGFARFWPHDNAKFVRTALGSLAEVKNHLLDALKQKYINETEYAEMSRLARRAIGETTRWHQYLKSCKPGDPTAWLKKAKDRNQSPEAGEP